MEIQTRVQKIEEALEHLKYKENILEFEQPRVDVTDQDADAEANPPWWSPRLRLLPLSRLPPRLQTTL